MGLDRLVHINARFNKQLELFKLGELKPNVVLSLGKPLDILMAAGLNESEITLSQSVLSDKIKKHGLAVEELNGLAMSIQKPIMVYEWGVKAKSVVIVTELERTNAERITVAIAAKRKGKELFVNDIASVHGKSVERILFDFSKAVGENAIKKLENNLRWVEKEKALDWLGLVPPKGTASQDNQGHLTIDWLAMAPPLGARQINQELLTIANIIKNFKNPKINNYEYYETSINL